MPARRPAARRPDQPRPVVLLAGPGDTTDIVANRLAGEVDDLRVIVESAPSRRQMASRRARRVGWPTVAGQVLFITGALPLLRWRARARIAEILAESGMDTTPWRDVLRVESANDPGTVALLESLHPRVVVVNGTRILSPTLLRAADCPVINTHAGLTPRYRGVHGGYWALAEGHPELVGTTVHLIDEGIDTGAVLGRARFSPTRRDSVATYPYLHLAAGLPLLAEQVRLILQDGRPVQVDDGAPHGESRLYYHPTLAEYLRHLVRDGVR